MAEPHTLTFPVHQEEKNGRPGCSARPRLCRNHSEAPLAPGSRRRSGRRRWPKDGPWRSMMPSPTR